MDLYLNYGTLVAGLICLLVLLASYKKHKNTDGFRIIFFIFFIFLVADIVAWALTELKILNIGYYNVVMVLQGTLVFGVLVSKLHSGWWKAGIYILGLISLIFYFFNLFKLQGVNTFNNYSYIIFGFTIAVCSFLLLQQMFSDISIPVFSSNWLWFSLANLVLYTASIPIWTIYDHLVSNIVQIKALFAINTTVFIFWYILITIGLSWRSKIQT